MPKDDLLILGQATEKGAREIKEVFNQLQYWSGLQLVLGESCFPSMVPQVIDMFNEYSSLQHQLSIRKVALMDLPNTSENIISKPAENSPFTKERESMMDSIKSFCTKRQQPDSSSSPSSHQPIVNKGVNGHIVYVRRKLDTERGKKNNSNIADSSSSSILSRKSENEETKDPEVLQDITQRCSESSHSNWLEPKDSAVTATTHSPVDPEKSNNHKSNSPVHLLRPSNHGPHVPIDPQRSSDQECKAPVAAQKSTNQGCKALIDSQRSSYQRLNAPIDPQWSNDQECKAPVDTQKSTDQDCKAPIDSQRSSHQCPNAPIDPPRSSDKKCKAPVNPQKLTDQDSKDLVDVQRSINQDWKERYLKLQRFLKDCDQSSQEDYKRMLRSLTASGRSKHALELEKRALHLLLEEGKELHRMQVLNVIGEVVLQDNASPSTPTSASPSQFQTLETMNNPNSPFLRNGH